MFQRDSKVTWVAPPEGIELAGQPALEARTLAAGARPEEISAYNLLTAIATLDMPAVPGPPEDELSELLRAAAEVEHGLMAQYLYAAYSCNSGVIASQIARIARE